MEKTAINISEIGLKAKSKHELYRLLTVESGLYLPPEQYTNINFIRDILHNERKVLFNEQVRVCTVPQISNLRIKDFIMFLLNSIPDGEEYLPKDYQTKSLCRTWIVNICNTLGGADFSDFFKSVLSEREYRILSKNQMQIDIADRIAVSLKDSKMVSVMPGRSHFLLKKPKNKQKHSSQIYEESKDLFELDEKNLKIKELESEIVIMNNELKEHQKTSKEHDKYSKLLAELFDKGVIDGEGNLLSDLTD